ncbi:MAG: FAD-binding protein, partial [Planctomycetota bacterium]
RYAPSVRDLAPRDIVARSIQTEIDEGRGIGEGKGEYVHLDVTHLGGDVIKERLPGIRDIAMQFAGVDPIDGPIPVQPGQHYSMGGVSCDENGATPLPGLYAVGECSCISVHGANRLGGNSLLETLVFGKRAGEHAAKMAADGSEDMDGPVREALEEEEARIDDMKARSEGERQAVIRGEMKATLTENVGIFREEGAIERAKGRIAELKERYARVRLDNRDASFNYDLVDALELDGMLHLAEATAHGAYLRRECRGSHWRTDHPGRDDANWLKHTVARFDPEGPPRISFEDVIITKHQPQERKY